MLTLEEMKQEIEEAKAKQNIPYEKDKGYDACKTYLDNNRLTRAEHLLNIDIWECFKCLLYLKSKKEFSIERCERISMFSKEMFDSLDYSTYERVIDMLFIITDLEERDQILEYLEEPSKIVSLAKMASIREDNIPLSKLTRGELEDGSFKTYLKELREVEQTTHTARKIIKFIEKDPHLASDLYSFVKAKKRMELEMRDIEDSLKDFDFMIRQKDKNRTIAQIFNKMFSSQNIVSQQNIIHTFVTEEDKKEVDHEKDNQRIVRIYNKVLDLLDAAAKKQEITNAREIVRSIPKEEIKRDILKWIYEKNASYYQELEEKLQELSMNSINQYLAVLNRFHISLHLKDVSKITKNTPEEVEQILSSIPTGFYELEEILEILMTTNAEIAQTIRRYIDSGYLDASKVKENISLYREDDKRISNLDKSIEELNEYGVNPKIFCSTPELLWQENGYFQKNMELLDSYNLIRVLKTTENYAFLDEENLKEKIDLYTELGYYKELEQDIGLLNVPLVRIKRLELLRIMNIPVEDIETISEVLENSKFMIPDEKIEEYLLDYASLQKEVDIRLSIEELESNSPDKITTTIGGVVFSIPKIKRHLEEGKTPFQALFTNKRLQEEEYNEVIKALNPIEITKK